MANVSVSFKYFFVQLYFILNNVYLNYLLVLIVDPGLVMEPNNTLYVNGLNDDVYVKWPINLAPYDIDSKNNNDMVKRYAQFIMG